MTISFFWTCIYLSSQIVDTTSPLLEMVRKQNFSPKSLVVMLTNQGQSSDIEAAEKYDIKGYIIKAITIPSEVVSEVERIAKENGI